VAASGEVGWPPLGKNRWPLTGCDYDLSGNTEATEDGTDAKVWITCPAGKEIEVASTTLGVTVSVPEQTPTAKKGGVTYTSLPTHSGGESIEMTVTVTGITYTCAPAFHCALGGIPTEGNNGKYLGTVQVTCWGDTEGLPTPITGGARTGCKIS
jgi:hypothetical protein